MNARHPIPRLWLMTDERQGDRVLDAARRLPHGAGIVFRHYGLGPRDRRALFDKVRRIARRRRLLLLLADTPARAQAWGADGSHGRQPSRHFPRSMSVHSAAELRRAERGSADLVFLSPVFPTWSHPGASALGPVRFGLLARRVRVPVIALGGMDSRRMRRLRGMNAHGWAGIDAWGA